MGTATPFVPVSELLARIGSRDWPIVIDARRRFIDPRAEFRYVPASEVLSCAEREGGIAFDIPGGGWNPAAMR